VLLAEILGVSRAHLLAYGETSVSSEHAQQYQAWIERRVMGEPVAYILGHKAFYDRELIVSPAVLIPRPETELLLELALTLVKQSAVDVGTGSGALAVTLAALRPEVTVYAVDVSPEALAIARQNQQAPVTFFEGDLLMPLIERGIKVDLIMANLPYIAHDEVPTLAVSHYEPILALDGGQDGLTLIRRLLEQAPQVCLPGAWVLLEIGADQGAAMKELAQPIAQEVTILQDYAGLDRIVRLRF
jgi:release factor glutamine methyltransferase